MRGLLNMIGIGRATLVDDAGDQQLIQITEGARGDGGHDLVTDKVPRVTEFGFTSVPPVGSVMMLLRRSGDRARSFIFGSHHAASRPKGLKPGDTAIYDVRGARVQLTADGLLIDCAGLPAMVQDFSTLTVNGDIHCTGDLISRSTGNAVSLNALHDAYAIHKHTAVQTGTGVSGPIDKPV
jgi:phage baseplate assembly protein V